MLKSNSNKNNNNILLIKEYQEEAIKTLPDFKTKKEGNKYLQLKFMEEVGNISEKLNSNSLFNEPLKQEVLEDILGNILWYISTLAYNNDIDLQKVANENIEKLRTRHGAKFDPEYYNNKILE